MKEPSTCVSLSVWLASGLLSAVISMTIERLSSGHMARLFWVALALVQGVALALAGTTGVLFVTNQLPGAASFVARVAIPVGAGQGLLFGLLIWHRPPALSSMLRRYELYSGLLFVWSLAVLRISAGGSATGLLAAATYYLVLTGFWPICYEVLSKLRLVGRTRRGTACPVRPHD